MPEYRVKWEIDVDAKTPQKTAAEALKIMRDPYSIATVFDVIDYDIFHRILKKTRVDLLCQQIPYTKRLRKKNPFYQMKEGK